MLVRMLIICPSGKCKFKSDNRFKIRELEIPFFHLLIFGKRVPYFCDGHIEQAFDNKRQITHFFVFLVCFKFLFFPFSRKSSRASSFLVQKIRYGSIHSETSPSFCNCTSQNRSRPSCLIRISPH